VSGQQQPPPPPEEQEQEELDFLFDEEMEQIQGHKNKFTDWSDSSSDYEIDDQDVNKILIVTQTPPYMRKHPGEDRADNHVCHGKITSELAKVINDGLYYYEQDLWTTQSENDTTVMVILFSFFFFNLKTMPVQTVPEVFCLSATQLTISLPIFEGNDCLRGWIVIGQGEWF